MQTPKSSSSGAAPRISPQSISSEASGKNSPRSEATGKHSTRVVRQLKTSPRFAEPTISSSKLATRAPKERSPRVSDHNSSAVASPLSEKKRSTKVGELESKISELENDLKNVKDALCSSEASKKLAQKDAEESNLQLLAVSSKLEESEKKLLELSASQNALTVEPSETSEEPQDSTALLSALEEIKRLKAQLQMVAAESEDSESARNEHEKLNEQQKLVEEMKNQLNECKKSEAQAQELVGETLMQLEAAKKMVETLRSDGCKATEGYEAAATELEESRAHVRLLEELVAKLKSEISTTTDACKDSESNLKADFASAKLEVEQLRSALAVAEIRKNEDHARSEEEVKKALEKVEQIKSASGSREAELEAELRKSSYEIEELRSNLMDKETELQSIFEENDALIMQLENAISGQREHEMKAEIKKIKSLLYENETQCRSLSEENKALKQEIEEICMANSTSNEEALSVLDAARAGEREALMKVGYLTEEVEKSSKKAARVSEQLEAAQAANAEMEGELRKLKVQSDQWRKAAEVAASMLSVGSNGHAVERTGSMDNNYSPRMRRIGSPYADELDDDLFKKKNGNVLKRFGVLWKKPQK